MQSFLRILKAGFSSFLRNGWLSVASITVMILTLMTLSTFYVINSALNTGIKAVQDKIDISVYLKDDAKQASVSSMQNELANLKDVRSIKYISKDDAMVKFKQQHAGNKALLDSLDSIGNQLPASLEIKVYNPDRLDNINTVLTKDKYKASIDKISYQDNKDLIQKLLKATNFTKEAGIGFTIVFFLVSLIIIFNTVRIAIFSRMEEIEIMKLVGATPNFIKGPFLIEGVVYGLIATAVSVGIVALAIYASTSTLANAFKDTGVNITSFMWQNLTVIALAQLLIGPSIGVFSSWLAIRKHLKLGAS